ncbi:Hypothetical protein A7982_05817 [Minicystis rosea]|nr:Hypothetical protein A7982_05817 [Minicystis rosea]
MSVWWLAAAGLVIALGPCLVVAMRGAPRDRVVGLEAMAIIESQLFVVLARALGLSILYDIALALALLSFGGSLVFARFLERWL